MEQNVKEEIQEYYRVRAGTDNYVTSPDFNLREVEIEYLSKHLKDGVKVLDVGCGNGYSTLCHAAQFDAEFIGVDFVPEMIDAAKEMVGRFDIKGKIDFQVGDVTDIQFEDETFDIVISERCLMNLTSKEQQWLAMREVARVLKPGGIYLMLEGTLQGLSKLNEVRTMFDLEPIPESASGYNWFSNKFDEPEMLQVADDIYSELVEIQRFGMYYFISRVLHPILVAPEQPKYNAHINTIARQICSAIPNFEDMGHLALFVLKR